MNVDLFLSKVNEVKNSLINKATQNGTLVLNDRMLDSIFKDACNITARHCKNAAGSYMFTANNFFATVETNVKALKKNPDTNMRARKAAITALVADVTTVDADIISQLSIVNGSNPRIIWHLPANSSVQLTNNDDYVSIRQQVDILMPPWDSNKGKIFHLKSDPEYIEDAIHIYQNGWSVATLAKGEEITLISCGEYYDVWGYKQEPTSVNNQEVAMVSRDIAPDEDVIVADTFDSPITLTFPYDRTPYYGKMVTIYCWNTSETNPVNIIDLRTGNTLETIIQGNSTHRFYLLPGTSGDADWMIIP